MLFRVVATLLLPAASVAGQPPARDGAAPAAATTGAAAIRGRVVDAKTGTPLRGVLISASTGDRPVAGFGTNPINGRVGDARTGGDGRYELRNLPPGRYHVTAQTAGYIDIEYGQSRPAQGGKAILLKDRETIENVNFGLPLGGAIAGTVRDQNGDAMANVQVRVLRPVYREGRKAMNADSIVFTDDLGAFRLFGLAPASVWLSVLAPGSAVPGAPGAVLENTGAGLAPTYYPGTTNFAEARPLAVKLGEATNNLDFVVVPVNNASIRGVIADADRVTNLQGSAAQIGPGLLYNYGVRVQPDGSFVVENLTPGDYELRLTGASTTADRSPLVSIERFTLADGEVRELRPTLGKMTTGSGRLVFDSASAAPSSAASTVLQIIPEPRTVVLYQARPANTLTTVRMQADLKFTFAVPPGRAVITPYTLPRGWYVKAIHLNGADMTDGIDFPTDVSVDGIEIEMTNRPSEITGTVRSANGQPADDYSVLVFAQDPGRRSGVTRYFGTARPEQDGTFRLQGLPPADYFAVAVEYADPDTSADPTFLDSLARDATPFTLAESESTKLDLRLMK